MSLDYWTDLLRQGYHTALHHFGTPVTVLVVVGGVFVCWWLLSLRR